MISRTANVSKPVMGSLIGSKNRSGITLTIKFLVEFFTAVHVVKTQMYEACTSWISCAAADVVFSVITGITPGKTGLTELEPVSLK